MRTAPILGLLVLLSAPASAALVECEGRCDDGLGSVMVVQARCDDSVERCLAGCNSSGERVFPYATCEPTVPGASAPRSGPVGDPGGIRERDE